MKRSIFLWAMLMMAVIPLWADDEVTFTASAPDAVAVGDQFRLAYTVTTQEIRDFRAPSIKEGFEVLMGPSRSTQSSVQIINGKTTSTQSVTFTYILMAKTEGEYTIPGATITADGDQLVSNSVKIKVLPADKSAGQNRGQGNAGSATISGNDLFILGTINKTTVYEQEAILLTYKIYTQVDLRGFDNVKLPDFKGFHSLCRACHGLHVADNHEQRGQREEHCILCPPDCFGSFSVHHLDSIFFKGKRKNY